MKHRIMLTALALLLLLLCACAPSEGQTEPTRLTAPPPTTAPPTTLGQKEKALEGIGTICDIAKYGDGYLLLTHTGLYTVDKNLENRQFLDDPANKPFIEKEPGTLFERLSYRPNYEENFFYGLIVTSKGIFYICKPTNSYYFCGEPTELRRNFRFTPMEYEGSLYMLWVNYYDPQDIFLSKDGVEQEIDLDLPCFYWFDGKLCLGGPAGLYAIGENGLPGERLGDSPDDSLLARPVGDYRYFLDFEYEEYVYEDELGYERIGSLVVDIIFTRSNGETVERLSCGRLREAACENMIKIWFVVDDSHLVLLRNDNSAEIAEFFVMTE